MTTTMLGYLLRQLDAESGSSERSDAELLRAIAVSRDQIALTTILHRYGQLVWAVCLRLLRNEQSAEDAFQATFIVMVQKAASIRCQNECQKKSLANWLYGVADRTARAARRREIVRTRDPRQADRTVPDPAQLVNSKEACDTILEEVGRLPERFRIPLILCGLEGLTKPEAARNLGWPEGTVSGRLARARTMLQERLKRRGLATVWPALVSLPAVPAMLKAATVEASMNIPHGSPPSTGASFLAQEVVQTMEIKRLIVGLIWITVFVAAAASGLAALQRFAGPSDNASGQATWQESARIRGFDGEANGSYSPNGKLFATVNSAHLLQFWNTETWKEQARYNVKARYGEHYVKSASFSADGKWVSLFGGVTTVPDKPRTPEITLVEAITGRERARIPGRESMFSPKDNLLAVRRGESVILVDLNTLQEVRSLNAGPRPNTNNLDLLMFSPDGSLLFAASANGRATLWEVATGKQRATLEGFWPVFSKDGGSIATQLPGAVVKLWDAGTGNERAKLTGITTSGVIAQFSSDAKLLLTQGVRYALQPDGKLIWDNTAPAALRKKTPLEMRLWDAATGQELVRLPGKTMAAMTRGDGILTPDGKTVIYERIAAWKSNMEIVFWDVAQKKERLVLQPAGEVVSLNLSPTGSMLLGLVRKAQTAHQSTLFVWDVATGKELPSPSGKQLFETDRVWPLFSPMDQTIALFTQPAEIPQPAEIRVVRLSDQAIKTVEVGENLPVSAPSAPLITGTPAKQEWHRIASEYQVLNEKFAKDYEKAKTAEERQLADVKRSDDIHALTARAVDLAKRYPKEPETVDALVFALHNSSGGDGKFGDLGRTATAFVKTHFLMSKELDRLLPYLRPQFCDDASDLLRMTWEKNPDRSIRARAGFTLARSLVEQAEGARLLSQTPGLAKAFMGQEPRLARLRTVEADAVEARAKALYSTLKKEYADVGMQSEGQAQDPETIGSAAERALYSLENLAVGKTAPEIQGKDLDGNPLKLSEYRGKVVVLVFCGDWCGPCKAMKPHLRQMAKSHERKPFVILEVNNDTDPAPVKERRKTEGNDWPCWWDEDLTGPIGRAWNISRWPTVFVLDEKGVICFKDLPDGFLQEEVAKLLKTKQNNGK